MNDKQRINNALEIAFRWGGFEGDHHRAWAIDQMVRALAGDDYADFLAKYRTGDDGPNSYEWDEGIPP